MNETLNNVFDIETIEGEIITKDGEVIVPHQTDVMNNVDSDYEKTRNNLHTLLSKGQDALTDAMAVAKASEQPRAFEVVGGLMKQLADINHQLLDLSEKRLKIADKARETPVPGVVNNNAIFVGSTTELNKLLKSMSKDDSIPIITGTAGTG